MKLQKMAWNEYRAFANYYTTWLRCKLNVIDSTKVWDHKFSVRTAWSLGFPPEAVNKFGNLELLDREANMEKCDRCSISYEEFVTLEDNDLDLSKNMDIVFNRSRWEYEKYGMAKAKQAKQKLRDRVRSKEQQLNLVLNQIQQGKTTFTKCELPIGLRLDQVQAAAGGVIKRIGKDKVTTLVIGE